MTAKYFNIETFDKSSISVRTSSHGTTYTERLTYIITVVAAVIVVVVVLC